MPFAEYTKVPVDRTKTEIETLISKRGASHFISATEPGAVMIAFTMQARNIRFRMPMPKDLAPQGQRSRWRALLLVIKSKFESVDAKIETFEESFLGHIVVPGTAGRTVMEELREPLQLKYHGADVPLLPAPGGVKS